ncbi:MAG TPA: CPBP family intramembrane glutamic endopeptidase [Thermoanaerobaculia bacterium]|nr:CPBP family intramembrane glutamic endopeptidase [Thermoanaerobaculia bacterium]
MCFYLATFFVLTWLRFPLVYWSGLISASVATFVSVAILERGKWPLGIFVSPRFALRDFALGTWWGIALIGGAALLIVLTSDLRHVRGPGFPWRELATTFLPAAVHEELLFRGYVFQKLASWKRGFAVLFGAFLFAALHLGNPSISRLALFNILLGGILLGLAYLAYQRLWFPIGLHLSWNLMSGPILGHEVSGYEALRTVLVTRGDGPVWITGGNFGLEGSVWATVAELVAIALLARRHIIRRRISPAGSDV